MANDRHHRLLLWPTAYLLLSAFSGLLEVGVLIHVARSDMPLVAVPLAAVTYQCGALLCNPIRLPSFLYPFLACLGALAGALSGSSIAWGLLAVIGVSAGLQYARERTKHYCQVSTLAKRVARIAGFLLAPMLTTWLVSAAGLASAAIATVAITSSGMRGGRAGGSRMHLHPISITMAIHQVHYFLYACFIPWLCWRVYDIPLAAMGGVFAVGWCSYSLGPQLLRRLPNKWVFIVGHLLVGASLCAMCLWIEHRLVVLTAWFISGFGGGTVYCLRHLAHPLPSVSQELDAWENVGHVVGGVGGLVICLLVATPRPVFAAAAVAAFVTASIGVQLFGSGGPPSWSNDE